MDPKSRSAFEQYVKGVGTAVASFSVDQLQARVERLVEEHDDWRRRCLNLTAAETLLSRRCKALLASDMATRLSEGLPGGKDYPHEFQNRYVDEIEGIIVVLLRRRFKAAHVDWRPTSTSMANAAVFFSLLDSGDVVLSQSEEGGGNFANHAIGPAGLRGLEIHNMPLANEFFEIDLDGLAREVERLRPKLLVFGGGKVLFPYPVKEIRRIADRVGALVMVDAAHLGLLISGGAFQNPLEEGAHVLTASTHKVMFGPVGGFVATNDDDIAEKILGRTFPGFMQTRDQNKYAALAFSLLELEQSGEVLAHQMIRNAQALAGYLAEEGLDVLAKERGYTQTHQVFVRVGDEARAFEIGCQKANILLTDCALSGDMARGKRTGLRLATHELTRVGLRESDMRDVARFIRRAGEGSENPAIIAAELGEFLRVPRIESAGSGSRG
jgi:glycine hydroxymethyltransferase